MNDNLKKYGLSIFKIPLVMQFNKRDLTKQGLPLMSIDQMNKDLNHQLKVPAFPASAVTGEGVGATIKECLKLTMISLRKQMKQG